MRAEGTLLGLAVVCAILLLFAPLSPRTSWTHVKGTTMRHSAGWDWVAPMSGLVTIAALVVGRLTRPDVRASVLGAGIAAVAFAVSAGASAGHWVSLATGALDLKKWEIHPATNVGDFAIIAGVGGICVLVLLGTWLRPGDSEW